MAGEIARQDGAGWTIAEKPDADWPGAYDYMEVTSKNANGDPLVIVYKRGGPFGQTVGTQTLTYDVDGKFATSVRS